jgi:V8-like Glu-specific endopeptidase
MKESKLDARWLYVGAMTVCSALSACSAAPQTTIDETGTAEDPLVGGINTTLRPEIGLLAMNDGSCTATLIGPRYVLAAGHCFDFSTGLDGANIVLQNSSTPFTASAVHLFGSNSPAFFEVPDGTGDVDDVALVQLSSAVPASVASPAMVSPVPPNAYAPPYGTQTIFGFGCKNRTTQAGSGTKQYVTFTYGTQTEDLCPGDSGGPVVAGSPTNEGMIWGVNSGYDTSSGVDSFGAVSYYAEDILGVIRQWESDAIENGVARAGDVYSTITNTDSGTCEADCQNDSKCRGATFHSSNSSCQLLSAVYNWYYSPGATSFTGRELALQVFKARNGGGYSTLTGMTLETCEGGCARDTRCASYSFNISTSTCTLNSTVPAATTDLESASGVKRGPEANTDRPGVDYSHATTTTALACEQSCATDFQCKSFAWVASTKVCYLHKSMVQPTPRSGATAGVKGGFDMNADRPGSDYEDYDETAEDIPEICQAQCASEAKCQAFTFTPMGWHGKTAAHCWLKSAIPTISASEGLVSGIKGVDFF